MSVRQAALGAALGAAALGGIYAWLPWRTMGQLEVALTSADGAALARLLDRERFSASVAAAAEQGLLGRMRPGGGQPTEVEEKAARAAGVLVRMAVGEMTSPAGLQRALEVRGVWADGRPVEASGAWTGLSSYDVTLAAAGGGRPVVLHLERQGLGFVVVGAELPQVPGAAPGGRGSATP